MYFICIIFISLSVYSQDYYWYRDKKIFLQEGNNYYVVFKVSDTTSIASSGFIHTGVISNNQQTKMWGILPQDRMIRSQDILYQTKSFLVDDTTNIY